MINVILNNYFISLNAYIQFFCFKITGRTVKTRIINNKLFCNKQKNIDSVNKIIDEQIADYRY